MGGHKSTPEPNLLEALKLWEQGLRQLLEGDPESKKYLRRLKIVTDGIAEIESRGKIIHDLLVTTLRYTEAEVVWQARRIVHGHAFRWSGIHKSEVDDYATRRNHEVRRLIVAPKGDKEE